MLQSVDSLSDILFRLEHLNPKNPEEEALREGLVAVAKDLARIDETLMQIVDKDTFVSPAFRDLFDQLVTCGMESFAKLSGRTRG